MENKKADNEVADREKVVISVHRYRTLLKVWLSSVFLYVLCLRVAKSLTHPGNSLSKISMLALNITRYKAQTRQNMLLVEPNLLFVSHAVNAI